MTASASGAAGVDLGDATVCPQSLGLQLPLSGHLTSHRYLYR